MLLLLDSMYRTLGSLKLEMGMKTSPSASSFFPPMSLSRMDTCHRTNVKGFPKRRVCVLVLFGAIYVLQASPQRLCVLSLTNESAGVGYTVKVFVSPPPPADLYLFKIYTTGRHLHSSLGSKQPKSNDSGSMYSSRGLTKSSNKQHPPGSHSRKEAHTGVIGEKESHVPKTPTLLAITCVPTSTTTNREQYNALHVVFQSRKNTTAVH